MDLLNKLELGYYKAGFTAQNLLSKYQKLNTLERRLLTIGTFAFSSLLLSACGEAINSLATATDLPFDAVDSVALPLNDTEPVINTGSLYVGHPICKITDFGELGTSAQGYTFEQAVPEGGIITMQCGDETVQFPVNYSEDVFPTVGFLHAPDSNEIPNLGELETDVYQLPANHELACTVKAFPSAMPGGYKSIDTITDSNEIVIPIHTTGDSSSIYLEDSNTSGYPHEIEPVVVAGTEAVHTQGYLSWAYFKIVDGVLRFQSILTNNCHVGTHK